MEFKSLTINFEFMQIGVGFSSTIELIMNLTAALKGT
jgi:hypothetical protein